MARQHVFIVKMFVADDDQSDPNEVAEIIQDVLNDTGSAIADWTNSMRDTEEESRPTFIVVT